MRLGYVLARWPCWSETFVATEILAHEEAGVDVEIFALRPFAESQVHEEVARVHAQVTRLPAAPATVAEGEAALAEASRAAPGATEDAAEAVQGLALAHVTRERGIAHLHAHFARSAATVARIAGAVAGVPHSVTCHARDLFHEAVSSADLARRLSGARTVVTVSDFNAHWLARGGVGAERVVVVRNGLDLARFPFDEPRSRRPTVAAVGRLVPKKGFDTLVDAMAVLATRGVEATCRIAGGGDEGPALAQRVRDRRVEDRVAFAGPLPQREVALLLHEAAVFAAPSRVASDGDRDGLPTTILEAMACGAPVVSTAVTGIPEAVRDGETGLLVPPDDPVALADALLRCLMDEDLRVRLARNARAYVESTHDVRTTAALLRRAIGVEGSVP